MDLMLRLIRAWMGWVLPRPGIVLTLAILSAVFASIYSATHLKVQTDQLELISPNHPLLALTDRMEVFETDHDSLTVVIEAPTPDKGLSFLQALVPRIKADTAYFEDVHYRVDPDLFKDWALLYLDRDDLLGLRDAMREYSHVLAGLARQPGFPAFLSLINEEMSRRMVGELFTGFLDEEDSAEESKSGGKGMNLDLLIKALQGLSHYLAGSPDYISSWSSFFTQGELNLKHEGYYWIGQKDFLVVTVIPKETKGTLTEVQSALERLRALIRETRAAYPDVRAGVTGREALNDDQMSTVLRDMERATWISLAGVLTLMIAFRGSVLRPLIQMVGLVVGLCWTFGWAALSIGHLNMLSAVFAPLLIGLADDFGIHWFSRFEEEERLGIKDRRSIIGRVMDKSGPGIFLAAISTSLSFLAFVLTGFRGLMELGLITGMGTFLMLLAYFTVLPALSVLVAGSPKTALSPWKSPESGRRLLRFSPRTATWILGGMVVLCFLSFQGASRVGFDLNPLRLQAENAEAVVWEKRLVENSRRSVLYCDALALSEEEAKAKIKGFTALPTVAVVESVFSLLPEDQEEKIALLRSFLPEIPFAATTPSVLGPRDVETLKDTLERIRFKMREDRAEELGADAAMLEQMARVRALSSELIDSLETSPEVLMRLNDYQAQFRKDVLEMLDFLRMGASASPMTVEDIPKQVRDRFYRAEESEYLIRIYPGESVWESGALARFVDSLYSVDPLVVGDPVSLYVFSNAFKRACLMAALYAVIAIFAVLSFTFLNLRLALLALVPLGVGTLWTVAIMGWVGMQFNLANGIFMPLVLAAGVEYGVIILHRWNEGGIGAGELPFSTVKGIILAALTTTVGFGTLMLSDHRGIFSLGYVAAVGSLCVLAAAIIILPALLASFFTSRTK
jgi:hopanoid biosynthesis associated RND transporter like protein HpnN